MPDRSLGDNVQLDEIISRVIFQLEAKRKLEEQYAPPVDDRGAFGRFLAASAPAWFGVFCSLAVAAFTFGILRQEVSANTTDIQRMESQERTNSIILTETAVNVKILMQERGLEPYRVPRGDNQETGR